MSPDNCETARREALSGSVGSRKPAPRLTVTVRSKHSHPALLRSAVGSTCLSALRSWGCTDVNFDDERACAILTFGTVPGQVKAAVHDVPSSLSVVRSGSRPCENAFPPPRTARNQGRSTSTRPSEHILAVWSLESTRAQPRATLSDLNGHTVCTTAQAPHAWIATRSGLMPTMFITRVRL